MSVAHVRHIRHTRARGNAETPLLRLRRIRIADRSSNYRAEVSWRAVDAECESRRDREGSLVQIIVEARSHTSGCSAALARHVRALDSAERVGGIERG